MIEISAAQKAEKIKHREIVRCSVTEIELSDGTVLKSDNGEFDISIIKAILEAGE